MTQSHDQTQPVLKHVDLKPIRLNSFLASGGIVYHPDGFSTTFHHGLNRFVHQSGPERYLFESLEACACFIAFRQSRYARARDIDARFEWFVADLEEIRAVFPRKRDALQYCFRVSEDSRKSRLVTKIDGGIYQYTGPRSVQQTHYYIGLREALMQNGFELALRRWDKRMASIPIEEGFRHPGLNEQPKLRIVRPQKRAQ